jgi:membrane fusion protein (multidrug efflux system)
MAEPTLKVVTEAPTAAPDTKPDAAKAPGKRFSRKRIRTILLIVVPLIVLAIGTFIYLGSGRYISTDNAYVGSQKVLITPDISGKVLRVMVREGQHVKAGDELFEIDPQPFRLALTQAQAKLDTARADHANLIANITSLNELVDLSKQAVALKQRDVDRKSQLAKTNAGSQADLDTSISAMVTAQLQSQLAVQQRNTTLNQLLTDPNLPLEKFPAYQQAQAALDQAQRDLNHTMLRAPIDGTATQVDNIQLGRFVMASTPVFSVVDDAAPWVDANPKETDITNLKIGQRAQVIVDTFPDRTFWGTVVAVAPGTGSQFSILPAQNASGNWVKVVQRVPVRIQLDRDPALQGLRAGMSVTVDIDTKPPQAAPRAASTQDPQPQQQTAKQ